MTKLTPKLKMNLQRLLIIGGLLGLVFSKAEGISLLPFPEARVSTVVSESLGQKNDRAYEQTIRSGKSPQSKAAKVNHLPSACDSAPTTCMSLVAAVRFENSGDPSERPVHFSTSLLSSSVTRGPPAA